MKSEDLHYLYSLRSEYRSIRYDIRNIRALANALGNPHLNFRSVLVAGTNGKGSVAKWLSAMLPDAGLFISPHLVRLNERISINGLPIEDSDLSKTFRTVEDVVSKEKHRLLYPPTYFELVTAMAFAYFSGRAGLAVIEVGLGGRLDATNIVQQDASVITNVGMDHSEYLGESLSEIAIEKAGIIKTEEPVIIGEGANFSCITSLAQGRLVDASQVKTQVRDLGEGLFEVDLQTPVRNYFSLRPRIRGRHQIDNISVAVRTAESLQEIGWPICESSIIGSINESTWPGRLEKVEGTPSFILDGAHNLPAAAALARFLEEYYPDGVWLVFGSMKEKDHEGILDLIRPYTRRIIFTRAENVRAADPEVLLRLSPSPRSVAMNSVGEAIEYAGNNAPVDMIILVAGSLHVVGEARKALGLE